MDNNESLAQGAILEGPFWTEPVRVIAARRLGSFQQVEAVGLRTGRFYPLTLTPDQMAALTVRTGLARFSFDAPSRTVRLAVEAKRIRLAHLFDPLYAVSVSQVDPLPHQLDAIYGRLLRLPNIRFLLADDPGAGKTIMAGLLMRELKQRGLVQRTLIVVPKALTDQWHREMYDRFGEVFEVVTRDTFDATYGVNPWEGKEQCITSLDFAKQETILPTLRDVRWDLVIVDEAHKMAAYRFESIPNLIRIVDEQEEALRADREGRVDQLIESVLTDAVGHGVFRPYIWPKSHRDVDDSPRLSLVVLRDDTAAAGEPVWDEKGRTEVEQWWKRHGNTPRKYQNAVVFLLADEAERENMRSAARRLLACEAVSKDKSITLADPQRKQLDDLLSDAKKALPASVASCYRHVAYPTKDDLRLVDFGARAYTGHGMLQERVKEKLEEIGIEKLVSRIDPQLLVTNRLEVWPDRDAPLNLKQLAEWFPQYPYLPMLVNEGALRQTVEKGVRDGVLALAYGEPPDFDPANVKYKRAAFSAMEVEITESAWLLRPHLAEKYVVPEVSAVAGKPEPPVGAPTQESPGLAPVEEAQPRYREVHIEIDGWENWNDLLRYVIRPLSDQGLAPEVHVTIRAVSAAGIPENLIRGQIEVSLQQLGIVHKIQTAEEAPTDLRDQS